jgi:hypothetical protein
VAGCFEDRPEAVPDKRRVVGDQDGPGDRRGCEAHAYTIGIDGLTR